MIPEIPRINGRIFVSQARMPSLFSLLFNNGGAETALEVVEGPLITVRRESSNAALRNRQLVVKIVDTNGRMEDTDVGTDTANPQVGNMALAQVVIQIGVLKRRVAIFSKLVDPFAVLMVLELFANFTIESTSWRSNNIMWREELRFRVKRVVQVMSVGEENNVVAIFIEVLSQFCEVRVKLLSRFADGQRTVIGNEVIGVINN